MRINIQKKLAYTLLFLIILGLTTFFVKAYGTSNPKVFGHTASEIEGVESIGGVPSGAIMMFTSNCPSGWTRFTALDDKFPRGSSTYGATGGSGTHAHGVSGSTTTFNSNVLVEGGKGARGASGDHLHSISASTDSQSNLPPYLNVIFCKKD